MTFYRKFSLFLVLIVIFTLVVQNGISSASTEYADCKYIKPFAHRGQSSASMGIDENTVEAFTNAARINVNAETDVWVAGDGVTPVVMHDRSAKRTTGVNEDVTAMSVAEFTALKSIPSGNNIPTMQELVTAVKDSKIIVRIEAKGSPSEWTPQAVDKFISILKDNNKLGVYQIYSSNPAILKKFKDKEPTVTTLWKFDGPFIMTRDLDTIKYNNLSGLVVSPSQISTSDTLALRSQGYRVGARLADTEGRWQRVVMHQGFTSVMTDTPNRYNNWCKAQQ